MFTLSQMQNLTHIKFHVIDDQWMLWFTQLSLQRFLSFKYLSGKYKINLLVKHSGFAYTPFIKMLNIIVPKVEPWETPPASRCPDAASSLQVDNSLKGLLGQTVSKMLLKSRKNCIHCAPFIHQQDGDIVL